MLGGRSRDLVSAYDTTMYFQDFLHPTTGVAQCVDEALEAQAADYREMKIKTGQGVHSMLPEAGMRRDAEVVLTIRDAVGPDFTLYVDANFGYDGRLDLLEEFFWETVAANIFWFEEMVTADVDSYRQMRDMQAKHAPDSLLTCGEVDQNPILPVSQDLIDQGLIDRYQPDLVSHGLAGWMETERQLDHTYKPDGVTFEDGAYRVGEFAGLGLKIDQDIWIRNHAANEMTLSA